MAYQTCRVCGIRVPAGFTSCDDCYGKMDLPKEIKTKHLKPADKPASEKVKKCFPDRRVSACPDFEDLAHAL